MSQAECPSCGKSSFSDENYMKRHHKIVHGESLREKYECSIEECTSKSYNPKFCSQECLGKARRKYEKSECAREGCTEEIYKHSYCSHDCANKESWKNRDNAAKRPEVRKKLSEIRKGENNPFFGEEHTEESKKKISESQTGEKNHLYGVTGEDHPSYGIASGLKMQKVEETGHIVRSNWEKEVDIMLYNSTLDYEYEPETFELSNGDTYTPDFIVQKAIVIEVKGWPDSKSKERARKFMQDYPEYRYIVIGNKVPCQEFIDWENRDTLIQVINKKKKG